ncbi:ATP-binding protein [Methylomonas paludis]|uniref:ATP-binding protein n=1 Tax=Methylomonas paludis TaxID=1173101 RepID=A0A975R8Z9_9GAMM|nr:ATP-binding protein [Methylomonas paludis]QWF69709.1 ATP-binding protein [Methylomonas paludis]
MNEWEKERLELNSFLEQVEIQLLFEDDLRELIKAQKHDPVMWRSRRILEHIVYNLCESILNRNFSKKDNLETAISQLNSHIDNIIIIHMHHVRSLSNIGVHPRRDNNIKTVIDKYELDNIKSVFRSLRIILEWFIDIKGKNNSPKASFANELKNKNPYMGLYFFDEKDAGIFFGRNQFLEERLFPFFKTIMTSSTKLLALIGPSGSGKSSVARAGLIPLIKKFYPEYEIAVTVPTAKPLEALAFSLAKLVEVEDKLPAKKSHEFLELMQNDYESLRRIVSQMYEQNGKTLILVIDQFEEFLQCNDKEMEKRYLSNLCAAINNPIANFCLLITLRSDFLSETQINPDFNTYLSQNSIIVPVLDEQCLREAITEPAQLSGQILEEGVVQLLIDQSIGREGALPLLQHALSEIWQGITQGTSATETLNKIGGVGGALARCAQQIYEQLSSSEQKIARNAFVKLIQLGEGTPDTRRKLLVNDLVTKDDNRETIRIVLSKFATRDSRLLTFGASNDGKELIEITHDILINNWYELREWLESCREDKRLLDRIDIAAKSWSNTGRKSGSLWRPPDLDLMNTFVKNSSLGKLTELQDDFYVASKNVHSRSLWLNRLLLISLFILTLISVVFWKTASKQADIAENQATHAKENMNKARKVIHDFLLSVAESTLLNKPESESLRNSLVIQAKQAYDELAENAKDSVDFKREQIEVELKSAQLSDDIDNNKDTEKLYINLINNLESLSISNSDVSYIFRLAQTYTNLGNLYLDENDVINAKNVYEKAKSILDDLIDKSPGISDYQDAYALNLIAQAKLLIKTDKNINAKKLIENAIFLQKRLFFEHPDNINYQFNLAVSYYELENLT